MAIVWTDQDEADMAPFLSQTTPLICSVTYAPAKPPYFYWFGPGGRPIIINSTSISLGMLLDLMILVFIREKSSVDVQRKLLAHRIAGSTAPSRDAAKE